MYKVFRQSWIVSCDGKLCIAKTAFHSSGTSKKTGKDSYLAVASINYSDDSIAVAYATTVVVAAGWNVVLWDRLGALETFQRACTNSDLGEL